MLLSSIPSYVSLGMYEWKWGKNPNKFMRQRQAPQ